MKNTMQKVTVLFITFMIGCTSYAGSVKEVTDNMRRDDTSFKFILQFKGSLAYEALKAGEYDIQYWKTLSESDDPLASHVLMLHYLAEGTTNKAIEYAKVTYAQTNEKTMPLLTLHSLYETAGKKQELAGVVYVLGEVSPPFKTSVSYLETLNEFGFKKLEKLGRKFQKKLRNIELEYSNQSVNYIFDM